MSRAFSLIEVIIAGFIISLVAMAIFNIFPSAAMSAKKAEMQLMGDAIAQKHLEQTRAMDFKDLIMGAGPAVPNQISSGTEYRTQVEVLKEPSSDEDALKVVRVTVEWTHSGKNFSTVHEAWLTDVGAAF